ncbi:MAG: threonine ammonia-lyase [Planctomycetota bacterium]|jgi:threonine dehydratase
MTTAKPISLSSIREARERLADTVFHTPLVPLNEDESSAEIFLKLENLQPIGSFKLRGAGNAMHLAKKEQLQKGVWTASAGNWAQGVAWYARLLGVKCTVVLPEAAPETKIAAIERLGARVVFAPFDDWMEIFRSRRYEGMEGLFLDDFSEPAVRAGHGTIGLEILEQLPDVEAVVIPYGGGGLSCGIAPGLRALKPDTKLYAAEVETGAPLAASLAAGKPVEIDHTPSFVDGISAPFVFPGMWELASQLLDGSLVVGLEEVVSAIRLLAERNCIIVEGAGAVSVAAALTGKAGSGKVVCVISGGNIDKSKLVRILQGEVP